MKPVIGITCSLQWAKKAIHARQHIYLSNVRAVEKSQGLPILLPITTDDDLIDQYCELIDALLITGGGGDTNTNPQLIEVKQLPGLREQNPERYYFEEALLKKAIKLNMPVLGICRGLQMINETFGGTNYGRILTELPEALSHYQTEDPSETVHQIDICPDTKLRKILKREHLSVNSFHRQSVKILGNGLKISARAPDGIIEAVEHAELDFILGLQFHPEDLFFNHPIYLRIFKALVDESINFRKMRRES
jgi:putative glutamine amidotransferase